METTIFRGLGLRNYLRIREIRVLWFGPPGVSAIACGGQGLR